MVPSLNESSDTSRALLFGLLSNCLFPTSINKDCPLWEIRNNFSTEKKYEFVMELSAEEVTSILAKHEECFVKRFKGFWQE